MHKIHLASDNWTPAHPAVMQAVLEANVGYALPYGDDPWTEEAHGRIQKAFGTPCKVFIVPTGTGANVLGLKLACRPHESVVCTDIAHIHYQESGAAESIVGCKLLPVSHQCGKVTLKALTKKLKHERAFGRHSTSPRLLSITQPTEVGTLYRMEELTSLRKVCEEENLLLHVDGSRLYNAAVSLGLSLQETIGAANADILSLGGTKCGLMGAEAIVIFNTLLQDGSDYLHKQTLQLVSKMRYLSAQYIPFFRDGLWQTLAAQANNRAQEIASILQAIPQVTLSYPVETNQIFFRVPPAWVSLIQERLFCYLWNEEKSELRCIASWDTSEQEVTDVKRLFSDISKG